MFKYKIYDQNILSDISLDCLKINVSNFQDNDIKITTSNLLDSDFIPKKKYEITPSGGFFYEPEIGLFKINSNQISIKKRSDADEFRLAETLINFPLALSISLKKYLVMHASAIKYNNSTLLFVGKSKSGKSTLASYFLSLGAKLISEDICVILLSDSAKIIPSHPIIKLSELGLSFLSDDVYTKIPYLDKRNRERFLIKKMKQKCRILINVSF